MLQKCDKNATQIPTYLVKLSVASEPDNRVQRCQEFHYKKRLGRARLNVLRFTTFFPHVLFTRFFKEHFPYDFLPRRNIYIYPYISYIYKFT